MKIQNIVKLLGVAVVLMFVAGCGDGDSTSQERVVGGTASAPAQMSLEVSNVIVKNAYYNYFEYTGSSDNKLTLNAVLEWAITATARGECQQAGDTFIVVYDHRMNELSQYGTCTSSMTIEFPVDGTYIFQIQYPGNEGYFDAHTTAL